jgi:hypothetical protein
MGVDCAGQYLRSKTPSPAGYANCGGYPLRAIDPADVTAYAQRSGAQGSNQIAFVQACLLTGRLIYWKNNPGDCPVQTRINSGPAQTISRVGSVGLAGAGAASSVGLFATGGAGVGASAPGAGVALGGLPAIGGISAAAAATVVGLALIPVAIWGAISAHHKIAVAREQATICDVSQAYDAWEQTVEYGIANSQTMATDAKSYLLGTVEPQLMQSLQAIMKQCDAACFMQKALKALDLYAVEKLYDSLTPRAQTSPVTNPANPVQASLSPASKNSAVPAKKNQLSTYAIAGAGALGAVKLVGALA